MNTYRMRTITGRRIDLHLCMPPRARERENERNARHKNDLVHKLGSEEILFRVRYSAEHEIKRVDIISLGKVNREEKVKRFSQRWPVDNQWMVTTDAF